LCLTRSWTFFPAGVWRWRVSLGWAAVVFRVMTRYASKHRRPVSDPIADSSGRFLGLFLSLVHNHDGKSAIAPGALHSRQTDLRIAGRRQSIGRESLRVSLRDGAVLLVAWFSRALFSP